MSVDDSRDLCNMTRVLKIVMYTVQYVSVMDFQKKGKEKVICEPNAYFVVIKL
jgi:hypothetical protein